MVAPGSSPVPFLIARSMLSEGMLAALAAAMIVRRLGLNSGSPPPLLAQMVSSLPSMLNFLPRLASMAALCLLVVAHLLCPDMAL